MKQNQAWFSRLVRHPARKRSGSILTTPEPARGLVDIISSKRNTTGSSEPRFCVQLECVQETDKLYTQHIGLRFCYLISKKAVLSLIRLDLSYTRATEEALHNHDDYHSNYLPQLETNIPSIIFVQAANFPASESSMRTKVPSFPRKRKFHGAKVRRQRKFSGNTTGSLERSMELSFPGAKRPGNKKSRYQSNNSQRITLDLIRTSNYY